MSDVLKWQDVQAVGKDVAARLEPLDVTQGTPLTAYLGPLGKAFEHFFNRSCSAQSCP